MRRKRLNKHSCFPKPRLSEQAKHSRMKRNNGRLWANALLKDNGIEIVINPII